MKTRIQDLRKELGVTQSELADAVDVTRQTIISLEGGRYKASLVLAHKLAQFFHVTIEELFIFDQEDENILRDFVYFQEVKRQTMRNSASSCRRKINACWD